MAKKRDSKGRFSGIESADSGKRRQDHGRPVSGEKFAEAFEQPGLTEEEGTTVLEGIVEDDPPTDLEGYEIEDTDALELEELKKLGQGYDPDEVDAEGEVEPDEADPPERVLEFTEEELEAPVTVKVDGEEETVPLREALNGYQRQAAFTRKTQELAREREEVQQTRSEVEALTAQAQQRLELLDQVFGQALSPEQRAHIAQAYQRAQAERQALQAHGLQETLEKEHQALRDALGWESEEDVQAGKEALATAAVEEYGFDPSDLSNVHDHRLLVMLNDARQWREMKARMGDLRGKRRKGSPTLKPGAASESLDSKEARQARKAKKRLNRTGSVDAGAQYILNAGLAD
jgi:hypothetical protein